MCELPLDGTVAYSWQGKKLPLQAHDWEMSFGAFTRTRGRRISRQANCTGATLT